MAGRFQANSSKDPKPGASHSAADLRSILNDDPDPLFLEECWALGVSSAVQRRNLRRNRPSVESPPPAWTPQDWTPEDRGRQRWIPQGWLPEDVAGRLPSSEPPDAGATGTDPNHLDRNVLAADGAIRRACQLLGVTLRSTPAEVRSAYRVRVVECHPDRLQHASESAQRRATRRMAELNEAYRVLRTRLFTQAA